MRFSSALAGLAAVAGGAEAAIKGFNIGAFFNDQRPKTQPDFEAEFRRAQSLPGQTGFNTFRLYSMVQWQTDGEVIQAIPAAIATQTKLLLGIWGSGGQASLDKELKALRAALAQHGQAFADLVVGLSVGSEDIYRHMIGEQGLTPPELRDQIGQVRRALQGTPLQGVKVGHVDTYDAYLNGGGGALSDVLDWVGFDGYPYYESKVPNAVGPQATERFYHGLTETRKLAGGKPVWVTETGWPTSGNASNKAIASPENARTYWTDVGCRLQREGVNLFWYILQEAQYGKPNPDFGVYGPGDINTLKPLYDLSCPPQ